jgi:tripartite-type tricarboxylate transporter receptor subunit TctC
MPFAGLSRRRVCVVAAIAVVTSLLAAPALAQSAAQWPQRPVRLLVTVGAGGAADTLSRNMANGFQQLTGQTLVV